MALVLAGEARVVGGRTLVVPLRQGLRDGDYTVLWRVVSDDGHTIAGVTAFGIGAGRQAPTAALAVGNGPSTKDVVSRWLLFAGLLTAVGAAFFRFAVGPVPLRLMLGSFLLVFVGVSGLLHDVPVSSRFGGTMAAVALVSALGAVFAAIAPMYPVLEPVVFGLALVLLPGPSIAGHALDRGRSPIEVVADVVHVAAASVWLGGLVALGLSLRAPGDHMRTLRRFSNIALVSVAVLAATGVVRALSELDSVSQLWTTGYGRALIVKSALLAVLVVLGWINRYRLVPRARVDGVRRNVAAELVLFAGLVVAVALLTDLRPGRDRAAAAATATGPPPLPAKDMVVQAREAGTLAVALGVRQQGGEVFVLGPDGAAVNGLSVRVNGVTAGSCGNGCYGAFVPLRRTATVTVNGRKLTFAIPANRTPAAQFGRWRDTGVPRAAQRRLRGAPRVEPARQGRRGLHARAPEQARVPDPGRRVGDRHRQSALGPHGAEAVGAVTSGSDTAARADLGRPRHERVPARADAVHVRRRVHEATGADVVHRSPRPPHAVAARPSHDDGRPLHEASVHELQRTATYRTATRVTDTPRCQASTLDRGVFVTEASGAA